MYVCISIYIYIYLCVYTYIDVYINIYAQSIYIYVNLCMYISISIYIDLSLYICIYRCPIVKLDVKVCNRASGWASVHWYA